MQTPRLLQTSMSRISVLYLAVFALSAGVLLALIYNAAAHFIEAETDKGIAADYRGLADQMEKHGEAHLVGEVAARAEEGMGNGALYLLVNNQGQPLSGNLGVWPEVEPGPGGWLDFAVQMEGRRGTVRHAARARVFDLAHGYRLLVGRDVQGQVNFRGSITRSLIASILIMMVLSALGGVLVGSNTLRRVDAIALATDRIIQGDLSKRLPWYGIGDEFDRVSQNVNRMLDQIEQLTAGMRTVIDSVAHDLRGPLTRLRGHIEMVSAGTPSLEDYREALATALAETERLNQTVNALLHIAQAESGATGIAMQGVDLSALTGDTVELYGPLAEDNGLEMATELQPGVVVRGHRQLLAQALANLVDNAIKYTPAGGRIGVSVTAKDRQALLEVRDTGPGIPEADRARVLKRFVRLDASRSQPGSGLGLSLVAAVAQLHRATLALGDNEPGLRVALAFETWTGTGLAAAEAPPIDRKAGSPGRD